MRQRAKPKKKKRGGLKNKLTYGTMAAAVIIACFLTFFWFYPTKQTDQTPDGQKEPLKAALVDHLSIRKETANKTFNQTCTTLLETAGYNVKYYESKDVNVTFYRYLPTREYSLVILRVHSAVIKDDNFEGLALFTSEPFDYSKYRSPIDELGDARLAQAFFRQDANNSYFAITQKFVLYSMIGDFKDTVIIMMGCEGLNNTSMAKAFIEKGAKVYISWKGPVSDTHSDQSTIYLLESLVLEKQKVKDAVAEIGPDPHWNWSTLDYYPPQMANYIMPTIAVKLTMNAAETNTVSIRTRRFKLRKLTFKYLTSL